MRHREIAHSDDLELLEVGSTAEAPPPEAAAR
jgi:hypothetical protein